MATIKTTMPPRTPPTMDDVAAAGALSEDAAASAGSRVVVDVVSSAVDVDVDDSVGPSVVVGSGAGVKRSFSCSSIGFVAISVTVLEDEGNVFGGVVVVSVVTDVEVTGNTVDPRWQSPDVIGLSNTAKGL